MDASHEFGVDFLEKELIEVGWILCSSPPDVDVEAAAEARGVVMNRLSRLFPAYNWVVPEFRMTVDGLEDPASPVTLLELAESERDRHGWDLAIAVTDVDLKSYLRSYAIATPSRTLGVALLSTARLRERAHVAGKTGDEVLRDRIANLAMHLLGDLNGLEHEDDQTDYMHAPEDVQSIDRMSGFSDRGLQQLKESLEATADPRLEEAESPKTYSGFFLRAIWQNRRAVAGSVLRSRPWSFPYRLSKLTTAAVSTMTVLLISAEAWDLGMTQSPWSVVVSSILVIGLTSAFVVHRQRLLIRRNHRAQSEQRASAVAAVVLSILLGMITTYVLLFVTTLVLSRLFFSATVAAEWAAAVEGPLTGSHYLLLAGFVATAGLTIGALGATFESHEYFRHIALVDEET